MKDLINFISESIEKKYVNIIVVSPNDEILILRRANYMRKFKGMWGFPGGSIDKKDKDAISAIIRELKEETGIELSWNEKNKYLKKFDTIKNDDDSISEYFIVNLESKPDVKISREHSKYEWFDLNDNKNYKWMPDVFQLIQKYYYK